MILATGVGAFGAINTRSNSRSAALSKACCLFISTGFSASGNITRSLSALICSFTISLLTSLCLP